MDVWSKITFAVQGICLFLCSAMLSGCIVHSVHPFYTADTIVEMSDLYGQWKLEQSVFKEGMEKPWTFCKDTIIIPRGKDGYTRLSSRFFKVHDMTFLDTTADDPQQDISIWWMFHISPLHAVSRVVREKDTLMIIPLSASWLDDAVRKKSVILQAVWREELKENLFTASSTEWIDFLTKYGSDPQAFPDENALVFVLSHQK